MVVGKSNGADGPRVAHSGKRSVLTVRAGESGLGKSTLINTLFETKLYQPKVIPEPGTDRGKTVNIESISAGECGTRTGVRA